MSCAVQASWKAPAACTEGIGCRTGERMGILLITHYQRILNYVRPDKVHVMASGRIVESGGAELVQQLESEGDDPIRRRLGIE